MLISKNKPVIKYHVHITYVSKVCRFVSRLNKYQLCISVIIRYCTMLFVFLKTLDATLIRGRYLFLNLEKDVVFIRIITIHETAHSISKTSTSILGYFNLLIQGNLGNTTKKY